MPEVFPDYSSREYWENRYRSIDISKPIDWLQPYTALKNLLHSKLKYNYNAEILVVGCGNSSKSPCVTLCNL